VLETVWHLGKDTCLLRDQGSKWRPGFRMVRCNPFVLIEWPYNDKTLQIIDCYKTAPHSKEPGGAAKANPPVSGALRLDPKHGLFSLQRLNHAIPPDFHLRARHDPQDWLDAVSHTLLDELGGPGERDSAATPVQTALRNCTRDEGKSFEAGSLLGRCRVTASGISADAPRSSGSHPQSLRKAPSIGTDNFR
jgi:hypothetical protein